MRPGLAIPAANGVSYATFAYNNANRISTAIGGSVPLAISPMLYDYAGKRIFKDNPGDQILYSYDLDGNLIEESDNGVVTDYIYLNGINVANWEPSEKHLYFVTVDGRGVPQITRDEYGLTNWASFSALYGAMTNTVTGRVRDWTGPQNLRLPGQYFDHETGFNHNGFRDYVPGLGRYLESDPIGFAGGANTYNYVNGNPEEQTDPLGLCCGNVTDDNADRAAGIGLANPPGPGLFDFLRRVSGFAGDTTELIRKDVPGLAVFDASMNALALMQDPTFRNVEELIKSALGICPQIALGEAISDVSGAVLDKYLDIIFELDPSHEPMYPKK